MDALANASDLSEAYSNAAAASCLSKPDGPPASIRQIVYGYIQQIEGVLPAQLAAEIEHTGVLALDPTDPNFAIEVEDLHEKFMETDIGPEYVACYEKFVDCLFNKASGALATPGNTDQTCLLGTACQTAPNGSLNPFAGTGGRKGRRWVRLSTTPSDSGGAVTRSPSTGRLISARKTDRSRKHGRSKVGPLRWSARAFS